MDALLENGFAWLMKVNVASILGDYQTHYWGCACPLKWVHPAYDMKIILDHGNFERSGRVVLAIGDSVDELQKKLLELCMEKWPDIVKEMKGGDE